MAQIIFLLVYLGLAYWAALYGRETRAGFLGTLLLSLIFTPILGAIFLYAFAPAEEAHDHEPAAEPQGEA